VGGLEAKGFAYVGVLVALEKALRSHYNAAWIALGIASAFHVLVGGWSVLALFVGWVCTRRSEKLTAMLPGLLAGGCIALIGLVPAVELSRGHAENAVATANRVYVFERLPHHLALLTQDADKLREKAIAHASALGAFFLLGITAYMIRTRSGRSDDALAVARIMSFTVAALCATTTGLVLEVALAEEPTKAAAILRYYWYRLGDFAVPMAVSLLAAAVVQAALEKVRAVGTILLVAAMAFPAWHLYETIELRQRKPGPPTERPNKVRDREDWLAAMHWINESTPPNALFLTPRGNRTFKWHTGRREVVNYKDVPQDATSIVTWYHRMDDVYGYTNRRGERKKKRSLGHLGTERVVELAKKYEVDKAAIFQVADRIHPLAATSLSCRSRSTSLTAAGMPYLHVPIASPRPYARPCKQDASARPHRFAPAAS